MYIHYIFLLAFSPPLINRFYFIFSGYRALRSFFVGVGDLSVCHTRETSRDVPVVQLWCLMKVSFCFISCIYFLEI